ncbi:hypothetical protein [Nioella halotolerans]|uniref:hypothetical protein n=1 Tax=Nioella halotolerans TaxID=2303578 RepID=UPI003F65AF0D
MLRHLAHQAFTLGKMPVRSVKGVARIRMDPREPETVLRAPNAFFRNMSFLFRTLRAESPRKVRVFTTLYVCIKR